jgi:circadian clock protein KaiB
MDPAEDERLVEAKKNLSEYEVALRKTEKDQFVLRLYVAGTTPDTEETIRSVRQICEEYLYGRYELEIVDLQQQPIFAKEGQIVAEPTLIKDLPPPLRKFITGLTGTQRTLLGLDLREKKEGAVRPI